MDVVTCCPRRRFWLTLAAGLSLSIAALLLAAFAFWCYRMVATGGSVSAALRMASSLGSDVAEFAAITQGGAAILAVLGVLCIRKLRDD